MGTEPEEYREYMKRRAGNRLMIGGVLAGIAVARIVFLLVEELHGFLLEQTGRDFVGIAAIASLVSGVVFVSIHIEAVRDLARD